eukprot:22007-Eustigmatos_ZCMA.PRE.1
MKRTRARGNARADVVRPADVVILPLPMHTSSYMLSLALTRAFSARQHARPYAPTHLADNSQQHDL